MVPLCPCENHCLKFYREHILTLGVPEPPDFEDITASRLREQAALTGYVRPVTLACRTRWALLYSDSVAPSLLLAPTGWAHPVKAGGQATQKLAS